jgi:hypothetical protein
MDIWTIFEGLPLMRFGILDKLEKNDKLGEPQAAKEL